MTLPSNELLSKVLGKEVTHLKFIDACDARLGLRANDIVVSFGECNATYNAYELMHLMKEWTLKNNFCIVSATFTAEEDDIEENWIKGVNYAWAEIHYEGKLFRADTEFEAVVQSCEWVLKQGDTK